MTHDYKRYGTTARFAATAAARGTEHPESTTDCLTQTTRTEFFSLLEPYGAEPEINGFHRAEDGTIRLTPHRRRILSPIATRSQQQPNSIGGGL